MLNSFKKSEMCLWCQLQVLIQSPYYILQISTGSPDSSLQVRTPVFKSWIPAPDLDSSLQVWTRIRTLDPQVGTLCSDSTQQVWTTHCTYIARDYICELHIPRVHSRFRALTEVLNLDLRLKTRSPDSKSWLLTLSQQSKTTLQVRTHKLKSTVLTPGLQSRLQIPRCQAQTKSLGSRIQVKSPNLESQSTLLVWTPNSKSGLQVRTPSFNSRLQVHT